MSEESGNQDDGGGSGGKQPYTGQKAPCTKNADCAGFDASYCFTVAAECLVPNCTADSCEAGWSCQDLGMFIPGTPKLCVNNADIPQ